MSLEENDGLGRLRGLYQDLQSLSESTLANIDRLWQELELHVEEFRKLLDKPVKNDKSRNALSSEPCRLDGEEYSLNQEFKQETIQLADTLNLDELEAAKLLLQTQRGGKELDRTLLASSIILFHTQRHYLLECVRLSFQNAADYEREDDITSPFRELVGLILQNDGGQPQNGSAYWKKCLGSMIEIEKWLQTISDRVNSMSVVGQVQSPEFTEVMEFQRSSLMRQHESLAAIVFYLAKANQITSEDFRFLLSRLKGFDKYDLLFHYIPVTICSISRCASAESYCSLEEARAIHQLMTGPKDNDGWKLRNFQAATTVWWLAEYSGRYIENLPGISLQGVDLEAEADTRVALFMEGLRDGAFQFMLSACRACTFNDWPDQLREEFAIWLLQDAPPPQAENFRMQPYLQSLLMDQLQAFGEAYITNMPDSLRKLKADEDEQRKLINGRAQLLPAENEYHLERFLIILAYACEDFQAAAEAFWNDPDSNLYGFLRWAAQRQATPRIAAFAELLRSISIGQDCAAAGHRFLLDEGSSGPGRLRRNSPLSWNHILEELQFYANSDKKVLPQVANTKDNRLRDDQLQEPETALMLECFLRLISHFCVQSSVARTWFLNHPSVRIHEVCLHLCNSTTLDKLKACAFDALTSLLTEKTPEVGQGMWTTLDAWISRNMAPAVQAPKSAVSMSSHTFNEQAAFAAIATDFTGYRSFVDLLQMLISPYPEESGLNDTLPFPEYLGTAYRMPGIEPYVDFVMGRVYAVNCMEEQDSTSLRVLRNSCVSFMDISLSTFNENLIIFANTANITVDSAMQTSSLSAYTRLHPFARVMEWLFNDKVLKVLFETAHQDIAEINSSATDSALITSVIRSIKIMSLIMSLQATYFDIVRPALKMQSTNRRPVVANSALASFEDAVLNHLDILVDLGLYCGSGHQDLVIASLQLLQQLASSRKLATSMTSSGGRHSEKGRVITALERDNEAERISRALINQMAYDAREIEQGPESPGSVIKAGIIAFLNSCLSMTSGRPTVAHLLLGFACTDRTIGVSPNGLFADGKALFHEIMHFILACPDGYSGSMVSWLSSTKSKALEILQNLWRSPISADLTLTELRLNEFLFIQIIRQVLIGPDTTWDGKTFQDPEFLIADAALGFIGFLQQRIIFFEYATNELRLAEQLGMSSLRTRIKSALLGSTRFLDGTILQSPTIFDLMDFSDFEIGDNLPLPASAFFDDLDYSICKQDQPDGTDDYSLPGIEQLLMLQQTRLRKQGLSSGDDQQMQADAQNIILCFHANKQRSEVKFAHRGALRSWSHLVAVMVESCDFDIAAMNNFILQVLNIVLPKLERSYGDDEDTSIILARLARSLMRHADFSSTSEDTGRARDAASDRLSQLFRVALAGIYIPNATPDLRQLCSQICCSYIRKIPDGSPGSSIRRNAIQTIKSFSDHLVEILCDDAYTAEGSCRISSLLFLNAAVTASNLEGSKYIIDAFVRFNFIAVVVDNVKHLTVELQSAESIAVPLLLAYYNASLSLLLRIAQVRSGAAHVLNAGLFHSVRESKLFETDPDIGLEMDNPDALLKYFELLLAVLRVINTVVLSRGSQNDQTIGQSRQFVKECRPTIVSIFKRSAKIGSLGSENDNVLKELVDNFTILLSTTNFLASEEDEMVRGKTTPGFFT